MVMAARHRSLYEEVDHVALMQDEANREEVSYETSLRAVGAFLDEHQGCRVRVKAVSEGFEVSYHRGPHDAEPVRQILEHQEIAARSRGPHQRERRLSRKVAARQLSYENLFRSLGHQLQEASGHLLVLDEFDDSILLTYEHHGRTSVGAPYKRQVVLNRDDTCSILAHGVDRRSQRQ